MRSTLHLLRLPSLDQQLLLLSASEKCFLSIIVISTTLIFSNQFQMSPLVEDLVMTYVIFTQPHPDFTSQSKKNKLWRSTKWLKSRTNGPSLSLSQILICIVNSYIIKAHQLGIRGVFIVAISYVDHCLLFDLAEHRKKSWFHSVAVQCVLPGLVQGLVCHGHNLKR